MALTTLCCLNQSTGLAFTICVATITECFTVVVQVTLKLTLSLHLGTDLKKNKRMQVGNGTTRLMSLSGVVSSLILCLFHPHFQQTSKNQIRVDLVDENFTELRGEIAGPPDTPYEGTHSRPHLYPYIHSTYGMLF